ncbi:M23 family metallopeptidase [Desulfonatronospira sp.]|uniref:M23 family metallopeptidase n=1 Tax=Desulfonatronospira sp. TaxID=1962951 RepID=UPI0025C20FF1|nr:M23 family metallopeptidase [Desulfonatronospira sp.]
MAIRLKKGFWLLLILLLAVGAGYTYINYWDTDEPVIHVDPEVRYTNAERLFDIQIHDQGLGLKNVEVQVVQDGQVKKTFQEEIDPGINDMQFTMELPRLDQGSFELQVRAVDRSIVNWGRGNESLVTREMIFDSIPPSISLISAVHNLNQGGAGLVIYSLSKEAEKTGVKLGDYFFPAFRKPDGNYYCIFSFAYNADTQRDVPRVTAVDRAGNRQVSGFNYHVNSRSFRQADLNINDEFLRSQMPQFESRYPDESDPLEIFLRVNRDLREQNRSKVQEIASRTSANFRVQGALLRKPSAFMAGYADHRTYFYDGEEIDQQVHLGVDLASTAQAPVPAAERGEVVFTGDLGIYGQTVILDHGLGLQTLYAHLSSIDVRDGQEVSRGDHIGRTGTTGLAVGDHLHFEVLVSGLPVNPAEWWDGTWLENNIFSKLRD